MNKKKLLNSLFSQFDFNKNQKDILLTLEKGDFTAEEILRNTTVSSGRIYSVLGELEKMKLITKKPGKPAIYSLKNFSNKVEKYLELKFNQEIKNQERITKLVNQVENRNEIKIIEGEGNWDFQVRKLYKESKWTKSIHKYLNFAWFLYIWDKSIFLKFREKIQKERIFGSDPSYPELMAKKEMYLEHYKEKNVEQVINTRALSIFLKYLSECIDLEKQTEYIKLLLEKFNKYKKTKIYVTDTLYLPYSTYISDKGVLMTFHFTKGEQKILSMTGESISESFINVFNEFKSNSHEVEDSLHKHLITLQ